MPLMGSRGGGSVRGFGRFGKVLLLAIIDSFNRSTSGTLGTSSDGKGVWKNVRGTWSANGSAASNSDTASNNNVAVIDLDGTNISNLQIDTAASGGGTGVSFWVQDSNNYYAAYPTYGTQTQTTQICGGSSGSGSSLPANACNAASVGTGQWYNWCEFAGRVEPTGTSPSCGSVPSQWNTVVTKNCGPGWYLEQCIPSGGYTWGGQSQSQSITNYQSTFKLLQTVGGSTSEVVNTTYNNTTAGYSPTRSVAISTSGSVITYNVYSSTNKGGSVLATGTYNAGSPTKGYGVGVFRGASSTQQGSTLTAFAATVTP